MVETPLQGLTVIVNRIPGPALARLAPARVITSGAFSPAPCPAKQVSDYGGPLCHSVLRNNTVAALIARTVNANKNSKSPLIAINPVFFNTSCLNPCTA